jgi:hypothetical protein
MFFVVLSAASATEIDNVSNTEDSNLTNDNVIALSQEKLEVSNEVSISETNIVNSHDDNLKDYPEDDALKLSDDSYYEDNGEQKLSLANENIEDTVSISENESVIGSSSQDDVLGASKVSTTISVSNTHYDKAATYFKVTLQDSTGKALSNQKISLKVKSKTYSANTDKNGIATVKTAALAIGTYDVTVTYSGNGNYSSKSLSKSVKVLSSVTGNDLTKYYGDSTYYSATYTTTLDNLATFAIPTDWGNITKVTDSGGVLDYTSSFSKIGTFTRTIEGQAVTYNVWRWNSLPTVATGFTYRFYN